jgi:hypothetical protein
VESSDDEEEPRGGCSWSLVVVVGVALTILGARERARDPGFRLGLAMVIAGLFLSLVSLLVIVHRSRKK